MTNITSKHLEPGALWTFVHSSGKRTEYVFEREMIRASPAPDAKTPGLSAVVALRNPETDKLAMVSEKWLAEGEINGGSHWLPKAEAQAQAA